jgi:DNA-binding CsgD family transcriptional regulator
MKEVGKMSEKLDFAHILTKKELEVCALVAKGYSNEQIAACLFIEKGTVKNHITSIHNKTGIKNRTELAARYVAEYQQVITVVTNMPMADETDPQAKIFAKLKLVGLCGLPEIIWLRLLGHPFVIGRFDAIVGKKQSDFEFESSTKAVSRRHASIEYTKKGIFVVDLESRVGTFINGSRITPGESHLIKNGDRLSFGNAGADYILSTDDF